MWRVGWGRGTRSGGGVFVDVASMVAPDLVPLRVCRRRCALANRWERSTPRLVGGVQGGGGHKVRRWGRSSLWRAWLRRTLCPYACAGDGVRWRTGGRGARRDRWVACRVGEGTRSGGGVFVDVASMVAPDLVPLRVCRRRCAIGERVGGDTPRVCRRACAIGVGRSVAMTVNGLQLRNEGGVHAVHTAWLSAQQFDAPSPF